MNKLTLDFQQQFSERLIFDQTLLESIDPSAKLHDETLRHPLSSSASCLNVIGSIAHQPEELIKWLSAFGLEIEELYEFPSPVSFEGRTYLDQGYAIFEWIGPKKSPINEPGGGRGYHRTSVDAYVLGKINGKTTQILIEWKFTEGLSRPLALGRFSGKQGVERFRRYAPILAELQRNRDFPFDFEDEYRAGKPNSSLGLYDLSPDPFYQLLRITLLAKQTVGKMLGPYILEDYRILHLTHSQNERINILHPEYLTFTPGLQSFSGQSLHDVWKSILAPKDRERFDCGYWDKAIPMLGNPALRAYLFERYG